MFFIVFIGGLFSLGTISLPSLWNNDISPKVRTYIDQYFPTDQAITITQSGELQTVAYQDIVFPVPKYMQQDESNLVDDEAQYPNLIVITPGTPMSELANIPAYVVFNNNFVLVPGDYGRHQFYSLEDVIQWSTQLLTWEDLVITKDVISNALDMLDTYVADNSVQIILVSYSFGFLFVLFMLGIVSLVFALFLAIVAYFYALLLWALFRIAKMKVNYAQSYNRTVIYMLLPLCIWVLRELPRAVFLLILFVSALVDIVYNRSRHITDSTSA